MRQIVLNCIAFSYGPVYSHNIYSKYSWKLYLLYILVWKHLELRRTLKSVFMYKILNNHTAPNLRTSFRLNNEGDNTYDLRNREIDLSLPKPNTNFGIFVV